MDVGVDMLRYPIHDPESPILKALVQEAQEQLSKTGCARFIGGGGLGLGSGLGLGEGVCWLGLGLGMVRVRVRVREVVRLGLGLGYSHISF